jgi:protein Tex
MAEIFDPSLRIAADLALLASNVRAAVELFAEGATVPFIARYRKEKTGGLDEVQLRAIEEKRAYYMELDERRSAILKELDKQGKLTPELRKQVEACWVKSDLEDIYLPYKPKRRTRAQIARERGLLPLAEQMLAQAANARVTAVAETFVDPNKDVPDVAAALAGARDIVAETVAERADVRALARDALRKHGALVCAPASKKMSGPSKFETYYDFREAVRTVPSHRYLAICRGEEEGVLRASVEVETDKLASQIEMRVVLQRGSAWAAELRLAVADSLERLIQPSLESELRADLKEAADLEAIRIFAENVKRVLLQPALGRKVVLGIDPGQRTGCKCVVVDDTGKLLHHTLINLVLGEASLAQARSTLQGMAARYAPFAIAVGNGTHGRETADFCRETLGKDALVVMVNESGASVYSASDIAREEFPDLDLTVRGAISIARRLQDPLAELVKLDPKVIGVGQYQHDVHQGTLGKKLEEVTQSCVSAVGVELNTASAELLSYVAGIKRALAKKIVEYRNEHGAFKSRKALLKVPTLGPKAFEQCAGFVRISAADNPLDASAVHPERYALVAKAAADANLRLEELVGNADLVKRIAWARYVGGDVGLPTLEDIQKELIKPGRDPRESFEAPAFRDDVRKVEDLTIGMQLEGVVTNVTAFGAFVDIGVHQDGLVHVSQLADKFVKDPNEVVRVGDRIKVRVLEVDLARKRIALTAKSAAAPSGTPRADRPAANALAKPPSAQPKPDAAGFRNSPFAKLSK